MKTGDAHRARTLLHSLTTPLANEQLSSTHFTDPAGASVDQALPAYPLAESVPPAQRAAHLHFLQAQTALTLDDYDLAADHAHRILNDPATDLHHTALAHSLLARTAQLAWNVNQA
jgi:hypothetical protein